MAGRKQLPSREVRLATPQQLWVLNREGRVKLIEGEELEPVTNADADRAIKRSMGVVVDDPSIDGAGS